MNGFRFLYVLIAPRPRYPWLAHLFVLAPLLIAMTFILFEVGWWGEPVRLFFAPLATSYPRLTDVMRLLTHVGNPLVYAVYLFLFLRALIQRRYQELFFTLRCLLFSILFLCVIMQIMKYGLGMPRPDVPWPPQPLAFVNAYASFPSGHTTTVIAAAVPLALWFRNRTLSCGLALLIALMGISRVWLGQHHPVDILGGMVLGSLAARFIAGDPATPAEKSMKKRPERVNT